jgi:hypothetical protein
MFSDVNEQRLLEASMAYIVGKPIMPDAELDELKLRLKVESFIFCSFSQMIFQFTRLRKLQDFFYMFMLWGIARFFLGLGISGFHKDCMWSTMYMNFIFL